MCQAPTSRPFVIGVTGNIACGKSTVLETLAHLGAETIDADHIYHELIGPGKPLAAAIRARFGDPVVGKNGQIDRQELGKIVFADPSALADLEAITHPAVAAAARERIGRSSSPVVAIDAVKLVESGMNKDCDRVWLIVCAPDIQLERLISRNGLSRDEAMARIGVQPSHEAKRAIADLIIDNSGDVAETRRQVKEAWSQLPILPS